MTGKEEVAAKGGASASAQGISGSWFLAAAYAVGSDGGRLDDLYGESPSGVITYGEDGRMVALITHGGRELLDGDRQAAPDEQKVRAYTTSIAYAGKYTVQDDHILHHVDMSTYPNWVGVDLLRYFVLTTDEVVLTSAPQIQNGVETVLRLHWQRTKPRWYK